MPAVLCSSYTDGHLILSKGGGDIKFDYWPRDAFRVITWDLMSRGIAIIGGGLIVHRHSWIKFLWLQYEYGSIGLFDWDRYFAFFYNQSFELICWMVFASLHVIVFKKKKKIWINGELPIYDKGKTTPRSYKFVDLTFFTFTWIISKYEINTQSTS